MVETILALVFSGKIIEKLCGNPYNYISRKIMLVILEQIRNELPQAPKSFTRNGRLSLTLLTRAKNQGEGNPKAGILG